MSKLVVSKSFNQFITDNRHINSICRLLHNYLRGNEPPPVWDKVITTDEINYITFRRDGHLSYLPDGKPHLLNDSGDWSREGRQQGKPSKIIRKVFTEKAQKLIKDKDFEHFHNRYISTYNDSGLMFELLSSNKIASVYDEEVCEGSGTLNSSCMNGDSEYLDIYNQSLLRILVLRSSSGMLMGRALVWKISDTVTFMDRIYTVLDWHEELFKNKCLEYGWICKAQQNFQNKREVFNPADGTSYDLKMKVELDTDFSRYPYIDTFTYGDEGFLCNYDSSLRYTYNNTDGSRDGVPEDEEDDHCGEIFCPIRDNWYDEDDCSYVDRGEYAGQWLYDDEVVLVGRYNYYREDESIVCDYHGDYILKDDAAYVDHLDDYLPYDECCYSEYLSEYIREDDAEECAELGWVFKYDCVEIDGVYYHNSVADKYRTVEEDESDDSVESDANPL